jgi:hypothetical protein
LSGYAACPEIDGWRREVGLLLHHASDDIVGSPPEKEE